MIPLTMVSPGYQTVPWSWYGQKDDGGINFIKDKNY